MPAIDREEQYGAFLKSIGTIYFGPDYSNGTTDHTAIEINDLDMVTLLIPA